jgi:hypothetical protein
MGKTFDKPVEKITEAEKDENLRYQIIDVTRKIKWVPAFGLAAGVGLASEYEGLDDLEETLLGFGSPNMALRRMLKLC